MSRLSLEQPSRHEDKFRVDFYQGQQGSKLIGRKQVPVKLVDEDVMVGDLQVLLDTIQYSNCHCH